MICSSHNCMLQVLVRELSKTRGAKFVNVHDVLLAQLEAIKGTKQSNEAIHFELQNAAP